MVSCADTSAALPALVAHADWSKDAGKRWMARAVLQRNGRYLAQAPEVVGELASLLGRLLAEAGSGASVFLGFDFPIGLPKAYAERAGIRDFLEVLPRLGRGGWERFYCVCERPEQISLSRPFYPYRPGGTNRQYLVDALAVGSIDDLRRCCELAHPGRRAAAPLFWTLGAQQVGKASIVGWRDVLGRALRDDTLDLAIWPFSGHLFELFYPGRVVVAETYPAEFYPHVGVMPFVRKQVQADRAAQAPRLLRWADDAGVDLQAGLRAAIEIGFGAHRAGEDLFDAAVGLFGMLNVLLRRRSPGEPDDESVRTIEGWILGQTAPA
jgi:hypothetical protein